MMRSLSAFCHIGWATWKDFYTLKRKKVRRMGDAIAVKHIDAYVQENGIIRLTQDGKFIARLSDDVKYEDLPAKE